MKRIIIATILCSAILCGCNKEKKEDGKIDVTGQWELMDIQKVKSAIVGDQTVEVFINFKADGIMDLWQKVGSGRFVKFDGTWTLNGKILSGQYVKNGKKSDWGSTYLIELENDLLMMQEQKTGSEKYIYKRCTIPDSFTN